MTTVATIPGDGIGPEITDATIAVLKYVRPDLEFERIDLGFRVADQHGGDPLPDTALQRIRALGVVLKGPLSAPKMSGRILKFRRGEHVVYPSVNNALRRELHMFANVRPIRSIPGIVAGGRELDLVIVREVSEGIYSGLEHRVGPDAAEAIKVVTRQASERIMRFAFALAERERIGRVVLGHKANVLNITDGLLLQVGRTVAEEHAAVEFTDMMVDALGQALVRGDLPRSVVVLDNQYGDILSDVAAGLLGSIGLGPGGNFGKEAAMFEACHGAAPDIAGMNIANPVGLMLSGAMLLAHIGDPIAGQRVQRAVTDVLQAGTVRTADLGGSTTTSQVQGFVIDALSSDTVAPSP